MPHWSLPRGAASARLMIWVAGEHGVSPHSCLDGTGLSPADLDDPTRQIAGQQELTVLRNILRQLRSNLGFGLICGARYHLTTHGSWGFALLSSPTLRSMLDFTQRYFDLSYSFNRLSVLVDGSEVKLIYDDRDNPEDVRSALVERDMAAAVTFGKDMFGAIIPPRAIKLRAPRPAYVDAFVDIFGVTPEFGANVNSLSIDAAILDVPQPHGDEVGAWLSQEQCRNLMAERGAFAGIAGRVRARIVSKPGEIPTMQEVAEQLGMSTRTLRNRLYREHTSYRELVEHIRQQMAEQLMRSPQLTVDDIAERLGYSDTSSFVTAFKRWKGIPPRSYKLELMRGR